MVNVVVPESSDDEDAALACLAARRAARRIDSGSGNIEVASPELGLRVRRVGTSDEAEGVREVSVDPSGANCGILLKAPPRWAPK